MSPVIAELATDKWSFSVNDLAAVPTDILHGALRTARLLTAEIELEISRRTRQPHPPEPERAVGIDEACTLLGTTRPWLERQTNWRRMGGFKDHDGHVKFPLSTIQRHIRTRRDIQARS